MDVGTERGFDVTNHEFDVLIERADRRYRVRTWVLVAVVGIPLILVMTCIGGVIWHSYSEAARLPKHVSICRTSSSVAHLCLDSNDIVVLHLAGWDCKDGLVFGEHVPNRDAGSEAVEYFIYDHAKRQLDSFGDRSEWLQRLAKIGVTSVDDLRRP